MMPPLMRIARHAFLSFALAACATSTPEPQAPDGVHVELSPPPTGAHKLRELKAVDGHGCGIFGTLGTYAGAVAKLREQARALGANYVYVTDVKEPAATRECVEKAFAVTGVAYVVGTETVLAPVAAVVTTPAPHAAAAAPPENGGLPGRGLLLGPTGCGFGSPVPGAARSLSFSARIPRDARFGAWIDRSVATGASTPEGIELEYDPVAHRIALVRKPGNAAVSVGPEPFALDESWHTWRVLRAPDRISVFLDEKLLLLYAAPAPSVDGGFLLEGERVEVSEVRVAAP